MKKFLANWELKILAILSAFIFWFLVIGTENTFYTFPSAISVKVFNLSNDFVVSNELPSVSLRLKINNRESIKNLTADDFSAFVDLEGKKEGEVVARVEVSSRISDIAVVKVEPAVINVKIEKINEKEIPIGYKISGDVAEGFQIKDVSLSKDTVIAKGSQKALSSVEKATALITLNKNRDDFKTSALLVAYDEDENVLSDVKFAENQVEVLVSIISFKNQKILGVQPNIIGTPDDSVWIKSINVNPSYIIAEGDQQVLEKLGFVGTQNVNVDGISENKTFTVSIIDLPEGIEVENGSITVSIEVQNYESGSPEKQQKTVGVSMFVKKFKTVQRGSTTDPASLTLVVEGTPENLAKMSDPVRLDLDISEISQSGGTLNIDKDDLDIPSGINVVSLTPQSVTVTWN